MFVRKKRAGKHVYLQVVENHWEAGRPRQYVIGTLGRLDRLLASGHLDGVIQSLAGFSAKLKVRQAYEAGDLMAGAVRRVGPALVFDRLWRRLGVGEVLKRRLRGRRYRFAVERAIYLTVLSRLFFPGSDRRAQRRKRDYRIEAVEGVQLHQLYRAMAWLGEVREEVEEALFARNRSLFSDLNLVFFDTTSLYFEGAGGESLGQYGYSKDHRPDEKQVVVGVTLDSGGRPISCPIWPGNTADVRTLRPVVKRLRDQFGVQGLVIVADRGMISEESVKELAGDGVGYILGVRMRNCREVRQMLVLEADHDQGYLTVSPNLQVREVTQAGKRYIICFNPEQAVRDEQVRQTLAESLRQRLKRGGRQLIGNKGYRRCLRVKPDGIELDEGKLREEAHFDGKYVLVTNTNLTMAEVALRYKELWQVERVFRTVKSVVETRPVYHRCDETIMGHIFCSFLALELMKELMGKLEDKLEWDEIRQDLEAVYEVEVEQAGKKYLLRSRLEGESGQILAAVGVAPPPAVRAMKT